MPRLNELMKYSRKVGGSRYGIELEVEGRGVTSMEAPTNWEAKRDGSLGPDGMEFVTVQAFNFERAELMLQRMRAALEVSNITLDCTIACSSHVHMNVQDLDLQQILNILLTYYILEDMLVRFAGEERVGNLFCLRLSDSTEPLDVLLQTLQERSFPGGLHEDIRSTALNLNALRTFGTLEFRAFRGVNDPTELLDWVRMIQAIREFAVEFHSPLYILQLFKSCSAEEFIRTVFVAPDLVEKLGPADEEELFEGLFRAQALAYDVDIDTIYGSKSDAPFKN